MPSSGLPLLSPSGRPELAHLSAATNTNRISAATRVQPADPADAHFFGSFT